ncbi:MAG: tetratricopeptide repeat protein, partial [Candidatus Omnitrophica bacterium]|nr:tetratricopeptide repeat protein [Candidatus Omnitrophota bacterium]
EKIKTYEQGTFELTAVLREEKANCFGYSQLFYVLGKSIGLEVEIISVFPTHVANLFELGHGYTILDLAPDIIYQGPVFIWEEIYEKVSRSLWRLKEDNPLNDILGGYKLIERINDDGIIAARYFSYGFNEAILGRFKQAIAYYNQAIKLDPNDCTVYYERGNCLAELGMHREAIEDYTKAIGLNPNYTDAYFGRGAVKTALGLYDDALNDYTRAIEIQPDYAKVYVARGLVRFFNLYQKEEGLADFREALRLDPKLSEQFPKEIRALLDK